MKMLKVHYYTGGSDWKTVMDWWAGTGWAGVSRRGGGGGCMVCAISFLFIRLIR